MGKFQRFVTYKIDCLFMLAVVGLQFFVFRWESPFQYYPGNWLELLLQSSGKLWLTTGIGAALYWTVVDYHPTLIRLRGSKVVYLDGSQPDLSTRLLRSFIKSFTLFGGRWLLLYYFFDKQHRFAHDAIAQTQRVKVIGAVA